MSAGRVLIIAGSDSGGGAGLQGDVKTVTVLGGHAMTAVTAITVQNTLGVSEVFSLPPRLVQAQIAAVLDDIGADAIKIGMLGSAAVIEAVADALADATAPIVVDPVMVAKGGAALLDVEAAAVLVRRLAPMAALVTPNTPELEALTGRRVSSEAEAVAAGRALVEASGAAVWVKGGHLPGPLIADTLITCGGEHRMEVARVESRHTHGTGCAAASAAATGLAQGMALGDAVARAQRFVAAAVANAPGLGQGHGPLGFLAAARSV